jgi:hypothetical protein
MLFNQEANIKIETAVSSGSKWNYMKYVNYLWPLVAAVQALHSSGCYCLLKNCPHIQESVMSIRSYSYVPNMY